MRALWRVLGGALGVALAMAGFSLPVTAQQTAKPAAMLTGTISINGSSTVRSWTCRTTEATLTTDMASGLENKILDGKELVDEFVATISVERIGCGNGTMESHLRKALKMQDNPTITFRLKTYTITPGDSQSVSVTATGDLTIAGTTKTIDVPGRIMLVSGGIRIEGEKGLLMTDFGVKPPKLMLGTLKVHDPIRIKIDLVIQLSQ